MLNAIYSAVGAVMKFFNSFTGNYILALLLFAVAVRILFIPLDIKQQKNSIKQMQLRPKEMAIRNKYKGRNDRATQMKVQQEIQDLYQKEGYSMFGGCLPLLIQLPLVILLYNVIRNPLTYICDPGYSKDFVKTMAEGLNTLLGNGTLEPLGITTAKFLESDQIPIISAIQKMGEYPDILAAFGEKVSGFDFRAFTEALPNFNVFGVDMSRVPWDVVKETSIFNLISLVPLLNFVVQFFSTKLMRKFQPQPMGQDEQTQMSMKIMDFAMPALTLWIAFRMNAAIGLYWIFQNIVSLVERFVIARLMPLPHYTEAEMKEIEKAAKLALTQKKEGSSSRTERAPGDKPRSLHRIDEDDDDVPPPPPKKKGTSADKANSGDGTADEADESKDEGETADQKNADIAKRVIGEAPKLKDESDKKSKH